MEEKQAIFLDEEGVIQEDLYPDVKLKMGDRVEGVNWSPTRTAYIGGCVCSDCPGFVVYTYQHGKTYKTKGKMPENDQFIGGACTHCGCRWNQNGIRQECERFKLPMSGYRHTPTDCDNCGNCYLSPPFRRKISANHPDCIWSCSNCGWRMSYLDLQIRAAQIKTDMYIEMFGEDFNDRLAELPEYRGSVQVGGNLWPRRVKKDV